VLGLVRPALAERVRLPSPAPVQTPMPNNDNWRCSASRRSSVRTIASILTFWDTSHSRIRPYKNGRCRQCGQRARHGIVLSEELPSLWCQGVGGVLHRERWLPAPCTCPRRPTPASSLPLLIHCGEPCFRRASSRWAAAICSASDIRGCVSS